MLEHQINFIKIVESVSPQLWAQRPHNVFDERERSC